MKNKKNIFFASAVVSMILVATALCSQDQIVRFAVSPFETLTADAENEKAGSTASKEIEESLSKGKWFELRKSGELEDFIQKLSLAQAGMGDEGAVTGKGKSLKIDYLNVGSVAKLGLTYEVDSRSVDINNWMIVHSSGCSAVDLDAACNYINKDVEITLTKEDLEKRNKDLKDKRALAVYRIIDVNDAAQDVGYGGVFAEILNSAFGALDGLAVMERTHLKAVIDAKALEMCGVIPNDDSDSYFAVRGIAYKFEGTVKVFPDIVCIGYQVVDTSNNRKIYMGYSETGSVKTTRQIVRKIAREVDDSINNKIGTIEVKTEPLDADVFIDDQSRGKSPVIVSMPGGMHKIRASCPGYETSEKQVTVVTSKVTPEKIVLKPLSMKIFRDAFSAEQKKDWNGALLKYDEFIAKYGDTNDVNQAYYRKGHIQLLYLGDKEGSLKTFESLIQRYPETMIRAEAYFGIARAYKEMGNTAKMNETVKLLQEKFPNEVATEEAKSYFGL